jgi:hypothetical protein
MACLPPSSRFVAAGLSRVGTNRPLGKSPCVTSTNSMDEAMSRPRAKKETQQACRHNVAVTICYLCRNRILHVTLHLSVSLVQRLRD